MTNDYKEYQFAGDTIGVGQIEVMDVDEVDGIKDDILDSIEELVENDYKFLVLLVTDILAEGSLIMVSDSGIEVVENAFDVTVENNEVYLDDVLSRKKQVIPVLSDYLTK